jgi:uncharacterized membrane protein YgcG
MFFAVFKLRRVTDADDWLCWCMQQLINKEETSSLNLSLPPAWDARKRNENLSRWPKTCRDTVHPAPALYARLAESIYASLDELDAANVGGAPKRPRLESIVVKKSGSTGNKIVSRQSWSAGILPANSSKPGPAGRGRGRGAGLSGWPRRGRGWGGSRGGRGGRFFWAPRGKYWEQEYRKL